MISIIQREKLSVIETSLKTLITKSYAPFKDGLINFTINGIENRYCPCAKCPPWYIVRIDDIAPIIIGWRKSVININWERSGKDLSHLFENENVTKDAHMIHAHGYEKCSEYLNKIIGALRTV